MMAADVTATFDYADGVLRIEGTEAADTIEVRNDAGQISVVGRSITVHDGANSYTTNHLNAADIDFAQVQALGGHDHISMVQSNLTPEMAITLEALGGEGDDTLVGGSAADRLHGNAGIDLLVGGAGEDLLDGGGENDTLMAHVAVDATALSSSILQVDYVSRDATTPLSIDLTPGSHHLYSGGLVYFTVDNDGTVDYDAALDGVLAGRGTSALRVNGAAVDIDATALSAPYLSMDYFASLDNSGVFHARLLPGSHFMTALGGGIVHFTVGNDGAVDYDAALEGVLEGRGTSALRVNGAAVDIDATALSSPYFVVDYTTQDKSGVIHARLLPGTHFVNAWGGSPVYFTVANDGKVDYDAALEGVLSGRGTSTLTVNGAAVDIDATALYSPHLWMNYTSHDTNAVIPARLLPGSHFVYAWGGSTVYFTVANDGKVDYDSALDGVLSGRGTNELEVRGISVTIDPAAMGVSSWMYLNWSYQAIGAPFTANLLPGSHHLQYDGKIAYFTLAADGTITADPALANAVKLTNDDSGVRVTFDYADRVLRIEGTDDNDLIQIRNDAGVISVVGETIQVRNGSVSSTEALFVTDIAYVEAQGFEGDDRIAMLEWFVGPHNAVVLKAIGHAGHDTLIGGTANDELYGSLGNDFLQGNGGNDYLEAGYNNYSVDLLAAQKDIQHGLYATNNQWQNWGGLNEKWVMGNQGWYFILPNGELWWDGDEQSDAELLATLDASYYHDIFKLVNAYTLVNSPVEPLGELAAQKDRELDFYATDDLQQNWSGQYNEKWIMSNRGWHFILPSGEVYRWDGSGQATGELVMRLSRSYYDNLSKLLDAQYLFAGREDNDTVLGGVGDDSMSGGDGDDWMEGQNGSDWIGGGRGNDLLIGGTFMQSSEGASANDTIRGGTGDDQMFGGDGDDWMDGGWGNDLLSGDNGNDTLIGSNWDSTFEGPSANDRILGGAGDDQMFGGDGDDWMEGQDGNDFVRGDDGDDMLIGCTFNQGFEGARANDTIIGGDGDDELYGGDGDDWMEGQDGNDFVRGDNGNDTLIGCTYNQGFEGENADDRIIGSAGDDWLYGGDGDDRMEGGDGNDFIRGDNGDDTLAGASFDNDFEGERANDTIIGSAGDDQMFGGDGDDWMEGQDGDDFVRGDNGNDTLIGCTYNQGFEGAHANDTIMGGAGDDWLYGGDGDDWLEGQDGFDFLRGDNGNDALYGGAQDDVLEGSNGDDGLFGGKGVNTLTGGGDDDRFLLRELDFTTVVDQQNNDVVLIFATGNKSWTDAEIEQVDEGLAFLVATTGNTRLLWQSPFWVQKFERWDDLGEDTDANNDQVGTICVADSAWMSIVPTIIHEMAHNWDFGQGDASWQNWLNLSGWRPDNNGPGAPAGFFVSGDGEWEYQASADNSFWTEYGKDNALEDWATMWEAYYQYKNNTLSSTDQARLQAKLNFIDQFMATYSG